LGANAASAVGKAILAVWAEVLHQGYEGMVAKDPRSKYVGGRTLRWLKVKVPKYREEERGSTSGSAAMRRRLRRLLVLVRLLLVE